MTRDDFETEAIEALDSLYAYSLGLTHNPEDAADLVQESFARALKQQASIPEPSALRPMLFRILYHCFVDSWRKRRRRPHLVPLPRPEEIGDLPHSTHRDQTVHSSTLVAEALSQEVTAALNELDDDLRETLWLREIEDFSYTEIAEILSLPLGTVRSRLSRARSQMAASLQHTTKRRGYVAPRSGKEGS